MRGVAFLRLLFNTFFESLRRKNISPTSNVISASKIKQLVSRNSTTSMDGWSPIARVYHPLTAGSIDGTDNRPHDRAVERAMKANYMPPDPDSDPHLTLFVARLNPETTEKTLEKVFSKYGDVRKVKLVRDLVTGFSKQYAFVEFEEERGARRARQEADQSVVEEHIIFVDWECERTLPGWIPRRLGGGFGGKKESGQLRFGGRDRPFRKPIILSTRTEGDDRDFDNRERDQDRESYRDRERERNRERDRERDRERYKDRDRDRERVRERDREKDRERGRERDKESDRERDRHREKDRSRDNYRERERDRDRERDKRREREGRYKDGDRGSREGRYSSRDEERERRKGRYSDEDRDIEEEEKGSGEI